MKLSTLVAHGVGALAGDDREFMTVSTDTRNIAKGDLFVALRGKNFDGHDYVSTAEARGACAVVCESKVKTALPCLLVEDTTHALGDISKINRREFTGAVVAITGSCGKTTVKGMLKAICDQSGPTLATEGNFNNHIGVPLTLLRLDNRFEYAIVEAGTSGKGEIAYLAGLIGSDVAVVTNVHSAHLAGFGSVEAIAEEKSGIFRSGTTNAYAVINLDDAFAEVLLNSAQGRNIIGFTTRATAVSPKLLGACKKIITAKNISSDKLGRARFDLSGDLVSSPINLSLVGTHNVANALAAIACALAIGISVVAIQKGLALFTGEPGRMQVKTGINGCVLVDDSYNANPGSMKAAIDFLSQQKKSLFICGDMGELGANSLALHHDVGCYAKEKDITHVFSVGVSSQYISAAIGSQGQHFTTQSDLVAHVKKLIDADTVVLVKGSRSAGMEGIVQSLLQQEECA